MTVRRIVHTDGSSEGANSAYVLPERGIVVDPGPPGAETWRTLRDGLRRAGGLDAVEHVLVTHWHADHAGLAARLAEAADATLHLHGDDAPLVGSYARERTRRLARDERRLREWGVPPDVVRDVVDGDAPSPVPDSYPTRTCEDGDTVAGVRVLHTPGHTLGHAAFLADDEIFVGDAVLPTYTPNVGGSDTRVDDVLATYLRTLDRLQDVDATAHPGHGERVDLGARVDEIRAHHEERTANVRAAVEDAGRATPWEVATALFGEMRGVHVKMGAGEAAAHLAALEADGTVDRVTDDPVGFALRA